MLRFSFSADRVADAVQGAVMELMVRMADLLSFCSVLQRHPWALRGLCCLNAVFIYFTGVQRLFHSRESECLIKPPGSLHGPSQAFYIANRSSSPSQYTPCVAV